ncbi:hypothetical protein COV16_05615, partial [Candidatus Woesearchaeota archaeon CG10_big_fil_rev_8_21_14_0_10_34_8]
MKSILYPIIIQSVPIGITLNLNENIVQFNGQKRGERGYVGLAYSFENADERYIFAYGNDIAGTIAAVRRLIDARNLLFYSDVEQTATVIDRLDLTGISVFDVMTSTENVEHYNQDTQDFRRVVEKILNNNAFEYDIKTVKTAS